MADPEVDLEDGGEEEEKPEEDATEEPRRGGRAPELLSVERHNALLHLAFVQRDVPACKALVTVSSRSPQGQEVLRDYGNECEFPMFVRGVIAREEGDLDEALKWLTDAQQLAKEDPK